MALLNKYRMGFVPLISLISFFLMANVAFAETKVFVEEYTYQASEADSKISSRVIALEQVKRLLLEKLGTYVESETEVKNFKLTKDQIIALTAGIVSTEIIEDRWDGKTYYLKAKIAADPKDVANSIDKLRQDRQKTKELEETRKKADEALKEVEKLKKELEISRAGKTEQDQYNEAVNRLSATDWVEKGKTLRNEGKWQEAKEAFTRAIELDPKDVSYYLERAYVYYSLGDYRQAICGFDKAIELNPAKAYSIRANFSVWPLRNYQQAIRDYNKAIELDPKDWGNYLFRGVAYFDLGDYRHAIKDFGKAIELTPKDQMIGVTFEGYRLLAPESYRHRGDAYYNLGDYRQAIRDYDKYIELNPKYAPTYFDRGNAYAKLGKQRQAINDYKTAARLGNKNAQDYLRSKGISW